MRNLYFCAEQHLEKNILKNGLDAGTRLMTSEKADTYCQNFNVEHQTEGAHVMIKIPVKAHTRDLKHVSKGVWENLKHLSPQHMTHETLNEAILSMNEKINSQLDALSFVVTENKKTTEHLSHQLDEQKVDTSTQKERLTRLEEKVDALKEGQDTLHTRIDKCNRNIDALQACTDQMKGIVGFIKWSVVVGATLAGGILLKMFELI